MDSAFEFIPVLQNLIGALKEMQEPKGPTSLIVTNEGSTINKTKSNVADQKKQQVAFIELLGKTLNIGKFSDLKQWQKIASIFAEEFQIGKFKKREIETLNSPQAKVIPKERKVEGQKEEEKKETSWLKFLLSIAAGIVLMYIKKIKIIYKAFTSIAESLKIISRSLSEEGPIGGFFKKLKRWTSKEGAIGRFFKRFKNLFSEEGAIGRFFKRFKNLFSEEGAIGRAYKRFKRLFSKEGKIGRFFEWVKGLFAEDGALGRFFLWVKNLFSAEGTLGRFFLWLKGAFAEEGIFFKVFRAIRRVFTIMEEIFTVIRPFIPFLARVLKFVTFIADVVLWPLMIVFGLIDVVSETIDSIKEQGFTFKALLDGVIGGLYSFFTFGLINFKDIKEITDKVVDDFKNGKYFSLFWDLFIGLQELTWKFVVRLFDTVKGWLGFGPSKPEPPKKESKKLKGEIKQSGANPNLPYGKEMPPENPLQKPIIINDKPLLPIKGVSNNVNISIDETNKILIEQLKLQEQQLILSKAFLESLKNNGDKSQSTNNFVQPQSQSGRFTVPNSRTLYQGSPYYVPAKSK